MERSVIARLRGPRLRHLAGLLLGVLVALAFAPAARVADAQSSRSIVGGPLTTSRLERLAALLLRAPDAEMQAVDRLHEAYLDRFRAELDPELRETFRSAQGVGEDGREFEQLLKRIDRMSVRIGEADDAFFAAAAAAVAEPRRAGLQRIKEARERQRLTGGYAGFSTMMVGNGTAFVDFVDVLARGRYSGAVAPEQLAELDALLATQGSRLTAQARTFATEARSGMLAYFNLSRQMIEPGDGAADDPGDGARAAEERRERIGRELGEAGKGLRKVVRLNHGENKAAAAQLKPMLAPLVYEEFREELALRALGATVFTYLDVMPQLAGAVRRIREDPRLPDGSTEALDEAEAAWRGGRATVFDGFLALLDETEAPSRLMQYAAAEDTANVPEDAQAFSAKCGRARAELERLDREFAGQLVAILGARSEVYFEEVPPPDGVDDGGGPRYAVKATDEDGGPDAAELEQGSYSGRSESGAPAPIAREAVLQALELAGLDADLALVETVYDSWRSDTWDARLPALIEAKDAMQSAAYGVGMDDFAVVYDPTKFAAWRDASIAVANAVAEAHGALIANLAGALGRPADEPALLLLRLREAERLRFFAFSSVMRQANPTIPSVHWLLVGARARPDEVRAVLSDGAEEWSAIAGSVREIEVRIEALSYDLVRLQSEIDRRGGQSTAADSARWSSITKEKWRIVDDLRARLVRRIEESLAKAVTEPDRRAAFARALQRQVYPDFSEAGDSAERQLDEAASIDGLSDDERARIDAMRAEYLAVFDGLTARMIDAARKWDEKALADEAVSEDTLLEEIERLRLDRKERTDKVRGELRRLLGPERAARVRGLPKSDGSGAPASIWDLYEPED